MMSEMEANTTKQYVKMVYYPTKDMSQLFVHKTTQLHLSALCAAKHDINI